MQAYEPIGYDRHSGINPSNNIINNAINNKANNINYIDNNRRTFMDRSQPNLNVNNNNLNTNNQMNTNVNRIPTSFAENSVRGNNNIDLAGIEFIGRRSGGQGSVGAFDNKNLNSGITDRNVGQSNQAPPSSIGGINNNRNLNVESVGGPVDRIIHADQQVSAYRQLRASNNLLNGNNNLNVGTNGAVDMNNQLGPTYDIASSATQPAPQVGVDGSARVVDHGVGIDMRTGGQQGIVDQGVGIDMRPGGQQGIVDQGVGIDMRPGGQLGVVDQGVGIDMRPGGQHGIVDQGVGIDTRTGGQLGVVDQGVGIDMRPGGQQGIVDQGVGLDMMPAGQLGAVDQGVGIGMMPGGQQGIVNQGVGIDMRPGGQQGIVDQGVGIGMMPGGQQGIVDHGVGIDMRPGGQQGIVDQGVGIDMRPGGQQGIVDQGVGIDMRPGGQQGIVDQGVGIDMMPGGQQGIVDQGVGIEMRPRGQQGIVDHGVGIDMRPGGQQGIVDQGVGIEMRPRGQQVIVDQGVGIDMRRDGQQGIVDQGVGIDTRPGGHQGIVDQSVGIDMMPGGQQGIVDQGVGIEMRPAGQQGIVEQGVGIDMMPARQQGIVEQGVGIATRTGGQQGMGSSALNNNNNLPLNNGQNFNNQNNFNKVLDFNNQNAFRNAQDFNNQNAYNSLQKLGPKDIFRQPLTGRTLDFRFMGSELTPSSGGSQASGGSLGGGPSIDISINNDLASTGNIGVDLLSNANRNKNQNTNFVNTASAVDAIPTSAVVSDTVIPMEGVLVASTGANNIVNSAVDPYQSSPLADTVPLVVTDLAGGAMALSDTNTGPLTDKGIVDQSMGIDTRTGGKQGMGSSALNYNNNAGSTLDRNVIPVDPLTNPVTGQNTADANRIDMNQVGSILAQNKSGTFKFINLPPGNKIGANTGIQVFEVTSDINGILAGSTVHDLGPVDVFSVDRAKTKPGQGGSVQLVVLDGAQVGGLFGKGAKVPVNTGTNNNAPADIAPLRIGAQSINMSGVGRLGKSVGSVPAGSGEVFGVFSLPSGLNLPMVDPSVSAIPKSIERAAAANSPGSSAQPHSTGGTP